MSLSGLGNLGAITTLSAGDAAPTIWSSISPFEKLVAGLNQVDYGKLNAWLANAYAGGYVVDRYDDPSQISRPSGSDIYALIQRFNNGVYTDSEVASAVQKISMLIDRGFIIRRASQDTPVAATVAQPATQANTSSASSGVASEIGRSIAAAALAFAVPQPRYQFPKPQLPPLQIEKKTNVVPWLIGAASLGLVGVVIFAISKRKG